jgi:hypothetical protein
VVDTAFLIVVAVSLCLVSAMIAARVVTRGAPARRVALLVAELWLAFILWIAVLRSVGGSAGAPIVGDARSGASGLATRLGALDGSARVWAIAGAVASVAVLGHLIWSLRGLMSGSARR